MKALIIAHDKNFVGGANRSLLMVIKGLREKYGIECDVILPGKGTMEEELKRNKFKCIISDYKNPFSVRKGDKFDLLRKINVYFRFWREWLLGKKMASKLKNEKYDFVYTNTRFPVVGASIAKKLAIPHITHIREFGSDECFQGPWTPKTIYNCSDKVVLISKALYNTMASKTPSEKLIMIHNGISGDLGIETHQLFPDKRFNMILTGRIVPDKGQIDAVKALVKLKKMGVSEAKLYLAGRAPETDRKYENEIKQYVAEKGLNEDVIFLGEVNDMKAVRKNMDIELMCAILETFGRVTVEGMRNGLLVIGSNTGGTIEIIRDKENGLLYEQGNVDSLSQILYKVYQNVKFSRKVALNGYLFSQTSFTEENNVKQIYEAIRETLS